jgi:hypothetical protein
MARVRTSATLMISLFLLSITFADATVLVPTGTSPAQLLSQSTQLLSNTGSCGGWVACHAYFIFNNTGNLTTVSNINITYDPLNGQLTGTQVSIEYGHYVTFQEDTAVATCSPVNYGNGTVGQNCTTTPGAPLTLQRLVYSTTPALYPGQNVIHVFSTDKPKDEVGDWNIRFDLPLLVNSTTQTVTFDTRTKGWAIWSNGEDSNNFGYYRTITLNSTVTSSLTDFPARFLLDTQNLITNGKMNGTCKDLRPVDGTTLVPYEIVNNTCNTTSTVVYVKVNLTGNATKNISVYYGNNAAADQQTPASVWTSSYVAVWHLSETAGTKYVDSTANTDGVNLSRNSIGNVKGPFAYNTLYAATQSLGNFVNLSASKASLKPASLTITTWTNASQPAANGIIFSSEEDGSSNGGYQMDQSTNKFTAYVRQSASWCSVASASTLKTQWQFWGMRFTSSTKNLTVLFNGTPDSSTTCAAGITYNTMTYPFILNAQSNQAGNLFNGSLSEARIANISRTDDWIKAEYQQNYTIGTEQNNTAGAGANESDGRQAILAGIQNSVINASYTYSTDYQVGARIANSSQYLGTFDIFVQSGNKRWAFNYDQNTTSNFPVFVNITPVLYVWQLANLSTTNITSSVTAYINSTN